MAEGRHEGIRPAQGGDKRVIIKVRAVVTADRENRIFAPGEIEVGVDGRLVYVGPVRSGQPAAGVRVINAEEMIATPGLVNTHNHAAMVLLRGYGEDLPLHRWLEERIWPAEDRLTSDDYYWGSLLAMAEMIRGGTTCFMDMYMGMDRTAEAAAGCGIRACLSRGLSAFSPTVDKAVAETRSLVKDWHKGADGRITTMIGPHAPYTCPPDFLRKMADLAGELGVGIHIHVGETQKEVVEHQATYKKSQVATLKETGILDHHVLAAHGVYLDDKDMTVLGEAGAAVAHCPTSNMKLGNGIAKVLDLQKHGVTVSIGTDGAASNNDLDMFEEMRLAAILQKGATGDPSVLPAPQVVGMATREGARALGLEKVTGSLEPGLAADIVLVNMAQPHLTPLYNVLASLIYSVHATDVNLVMVDGTILYENGEFTTLDQERIRYEVNRHRLE